MKKGLIKTPAEIEIIAEGGLILGRTLQAVAKLVRPGVSTWDLDRAAEEEIRRAGGEPSFKGYRQGDHSPYPAALCTSVNDVIVHGVPSKKEILREGDLIGLDLGVKYRGFFTDAAISLPVGNVSKTARKLLRATEEAILAAIAEARPGRRIGDVSSAIQRTAEAAGFSVVRELIGHGVGYAVHEEPAVPCYGRPGEGPELREGMVLAIEPMVCERGYRLRSEPGEWPLRTADGGLTAHFEHTVAITAVGPRILTQGPSQAISG